MTRRTVLYGLAGAPLVPAIVRGAKIGDGPCAAAGSKITIAGEHEPGPRMVVAGQVFLPDGVSPAPGVIVYAYHTDATGIYNQQKSFAHPPRLQGWMKTDAQGRYEYRTIRPAPYPDANIPAHVHYIFWGPRVLTQCFDELMFADDPKVKPEDRRRSESMGRFGFVKQGEMRGGILYIIEDFRMQSEALLPSENVRHGMNACHVSGA